MKRIFQGILSVSTLVVVAGCGAQTGGAITDGTPAHAPAATEAEAMQRCSHLAADRQAECVAIVKQRFHDTSP